MDISLTVEQMLAGASQAIEDAALTVKNAGGGSVYLPSGIFEYIIDISQNGIDNRPDGSIIGGGVNVIGMGAGCLGEVDNWTPIAPETTLNCPLTGWQSNTGGIDTPDWYSNSMFVLDGGNNQPIRISGIKFKGSVYMGAGANDNHHSLTAVKELGVKDFRIDHCTFEDFTGSGIEVASNYVFNPYGNCGVVDHNLFDNPYKDVFVNNTGVFPYWGYGIIFAGNFLTWRPLSAVLGQYGADIDFIEDNSFRRNRHCIAGVGDGSGGWAVIRHNYATDNINESLGSFFDNHGGGRGFEVYNNTMVDVAMDYRSSPNPAQWGQYYNRGVNPRGGAGVIFNNQIFNCRSGLVFSNDQSTNSDWRLHDFWAWNNNMNNVIEALVIGPNAYPITEGTDYSVATPTSIGDGYILPQLDAEPVITYYPYIYPHPLVTGLLTHNLTIKSNRPSGFDLQRLA